MQEIGKTSILSAGQTGFRTFAGASFDVCGFTF